MKLKELKRTVNVCWSPAEHYPVTLAAGSAAQQVDSSFSSSSYLELYSLNLEDSGLDLELKSSLQTQQKFQKIVWSGSEVLVGGCDGGLLQFYSSEKLLKSAPDSLLGTSNKHNGNVSALDINPYQKNLLASGASDSEIFIWDLNNTTQPMAPGNRSQPYDHVQGLAWNQQVQHILGSTFATRCVVWDLRKNEPIMKLSDSQSRTRWRSLAWHPSVATQVCIASEDDQVPVIQLWDLRLAASPLVTLEGHQKGVMSVSWCRQDSDLLLSAGKDGRVLVWNPNNTRPGGELLTEISSQQQWVYDTAWCPRDPSLLVAASFDQLVTVHSLLGGSRPESSVIGGSNIMDSFGGADTFSALPAVSRAAAPAQQPQQLTHPPMWLKRPRAARFAFGGKLVTFDNSLQEANTPKQVQISQVISEPDIVEKAVELDEVLNSALSHEPNAIDKLAEYCLSRGDACSEQHERFTWFFLRANFLHNFTTEVLNLLGFKQDEIPSKFKTPTVGDTITQPELSGLSRGESTETEAELSTDTSTDLSDAHTLIERKLANLDLEPNVTNVVIPNGEDATSLICRALVCGNLEEAVELCLDAKRISDALIIASLGSQELMYKVQRYHLNSTASDPVSLLTSSLLLSKWDQLVTSSDPRCWRQTLAAIVTHCDGEARAHYCEMLGDKLSKSPEQQLTEAATICYLVGMCADTLISRWYSDGDVTDLARVTSLALLARRAALHRNRQIQSGGALEAVVCQYAWRVASQGCLQGALRALEAAPTAPLRERLATATGQYQHVQQQQYNRARTISNHSQQKGQYPAHNNLGYNQDPRYDQQWNKAPGWPQQPPQPLQPLQPQPLQPLQTQPPVQPPRPGSVGPQGGLTSRSKYKVDPSVQSSQGYQYGYNNPITSQPQTYGYNSPLPESYQNSSVPNTFAPINPNPGLNQLNSSLNPANPTLNPLNPVNPALNPLNPVNPTLNPLNPVNPALNPLNPVNPTLNPAVNPINQTQIVNGNYYNQESMSVQHKPLQSGWNDPPMPSSKSKPKQEVQSQAPITHPLFGVEPPQHIPLAPVQQFPGQTAQFPGQTAQFPGQTAQYPGQQFQQYPGQYGQYDQYQQQYAGATQYQQQQPESVPAAEPPAPVPKAALPEQHRALQDTLDTIRAECAHRANNPQMKRKLEDVQRRLETLYDLLRDYKLSESAVQTLHTSVQYINSHDYSGAITSVTSLASGADFAAAASFLPGVKVLLQLAEQLQVYVS